MADCPCHARPRTANVCSRLSPALGAHEIGRQRCLPRRNVNYCQGADCELQLYRVAVAPSSTLNRRTVFGPNATVSKNKAARKDRCTQSASVSNVAVLRCALSETESIPNHRGCVPGVAEASVRAAHSGPPSKQLTRWRRRSRFSRATPLASPAQCESVVPEPRERRTETGCHRRQRPTRGWAPPR